MTDRLEAAVARFDAIHGEDPRELAGENWSRRYHRRLAAWVEELAESDGPTEPLRLAARCQHVRRWTRPRADYPEGRAGYKRWRSDLARFHGDVAEEVLREVGYGDETVARVRALLLKKGLSSDPEVQHFEDAICLTFLENELEGFAADHRGGKLESILAKTWKKMSPAGHAAALRLVETLDEDLRALVVRAVSPAG